MLKFDDVMNDQRKAIFGQRLEIMQAEDLGEIAQDMRHQVIDDLVDCHMPPKSYADQWDAAALQAACHGKLGLDLPIADWAHEEGVDQDVMRERIVEASDKLMDEKVAAFGPEAMRNIEKQVLLQTIDGKWREHLLRLEHLRSVVGFRGYAQRDPLNEYKTEGFQLFEIDAEFAAPGGDAESWRRSGRSAKEEQEAMMAQFLAQQQRQRAGRGRQRLPSGRGSPAAASRCGRTALAGFVETDPSPGATRRATILAPAVRARSSSIATAQLT